MSEAPYPNEVRRDEGGRGPARTPRTPKIRVFCEADIHRGERVEVEKFAKVAEGSGIHGHRPGAWVPWRPRNAFDRAFAAATVELDQQYGLDDDPEGGATILSADVTVSKALPSGRGNAAARVRYRLDCLCGYTVTARDENLQKIFDTLHESGRRLVSLQSLAARVTR